MPGENRSARSGLRCIVGARVSTDEQYKKGVSVSQQLDRGREKAAELGAHIVGYCMEPGISGAMYEGRVELQKALKQVEDGEVDILIWYDLSRMSRDIEYISAIEKRVRAAGGQLHFCTTEYSNTADGFLHRGIDGVVHQHQRMKVKEVSAASRRKLIAMGRQTQRSTSPMGFKIITRLDVIRGTHTNDQLGHYEIVPETAKVVREIFERYAKGESTHKICKSLQSRGIPTPSGRSTGTVDQDSTVDQRLAEPVDAQEIEAVMMAAAIERSKRGVWRPSSIKHIIENSAYRGKVGCGKTRNVFDEGLLAQGRKRAWRLERVPQSEWSYIDCPAIVSEELWQICNDRIRKARSISAGRPERKYMLTGLMHCPKCRRNMRVAGVTYKNNGKRRRYYHCPQAWPALTASREVCLRKHFWAEEIEQQVIDIVYSIVSKPEQLEHAFAQHQKTLKRKYSDEEYEQLKRELAQVQLKIDAAVEAQIEAKAKGIDASVYERILQTTSSHRQELQNRLGYFNAGRAQAARPKKNQTERTPFFNDLLNDVHTALTAPEIEPHVKQKILSRLIEGVTPSEEGSASSANISIAFRLGVFHPNQRWLWRSGQWDIEDIGIEL